MAQTNQHNNNSFDPASLPVKRKRGRPRKDDLSGSEPGQRTQRRRRNPIISSSSNLVGQPVSGVLDGTFDAGFLLTVRVGNVGPVFRGMVFDPRLSVPISAGNDVAPQLPMSKRDDFPPPAAEVLGRRARDVEPSLRRNESEKSPSSRLDQTIPPAVYTEKVVPDDVKSEQPSPLASSHQPSQSKSVNASGEPSGVISEEVCPVSIQGFEHVKGNVSSKTEDSGAEILKGTNTVDGTQKRDSMSPRSLEPHIPTSAYEPAPKMREGSDQINKTVVGMQQPDSTSEISPEPHIPTSVDKPESELSGGSDRINHDTTTPATPQASTSQTISEKLQEYKTVSPPGKSCSQVPSTDA